MAKNGTPLAQVMHEIKPALDALGELTWIDPLCHRAAWTVGPWDGEPDKVQWRDATTGLTCLAKRSPVLGAWCGYVGVDRTHPWHGKPYDDLPVEVHGGLSFADGCQEGPQESTVCHIPEPGQPDDLWWFGFDCGHAWDISPGLRFQAEDRLEGTSYKPLPLVRDWCTLLALQIAAAR
jgi:hypothetical protein